MNKPLVKVGQTLYSANVGNALRHGVEQKLTPMVVTHVGRKYFTLKTDPNSRWDGIQFHIDSWCEKTNFCTDHELYEFEQDWLDKKEIEETCNYIWGIL